MTKFWIGVIGGSIATIIGGIALSFIKSPYFILRDYIRNRQYKKCIYRKIKRNITELQKSMKNVNPKKTADYPSLTPMEEIKDIKIAKALIIKKAVDLEKRVLEYGDLYYEKTVTTMYDSINEIFKSIVADLTLYKGLFYTNAFTYEPMGRSIFHTSSSATSQNGTSDGLCDLIDFCNREKVEKLLSCLEEVPPKSIHFLTRNPKNKNNYFDFWLFPENMALSKDEYVAKVYENLCRDIAWFAKLELQRESLLNDISGFLKELEGEL